MTPSRAGRGGRRRVGRHDDLSLRDRAVLDDLARVRLLTGRLIQRLRMGEGSLLTQARRTRSLLQRLNDHGLVTRLERRIGGVRAGSSGFVYGLAPAGQRLTNGHGPAGGKRLRRPWEPSHWFAEHILAVSELYVALREAEHVGQLELIEFTAEPASWRHWLGPAGERQLLKPDAFVHVVRDDFEYLSFVEVDRSTESGSVLRRKALAYAAYWQSGLEQQRTGLFPRVLWLVETERRKAQLVDVLAQLDPETWRLHRVGLTGDVVALLSGADEHQPTKGEDHGTNTKY